MKALTSPISTYFFSNYVVQDIQNDPTDEEDLKSSQDYLDDVNEEFEARALLANSKRFFKIIHPRCVVQNPWTNLNATSVVELVTWP
ncbi:hypothetical protein Tco_0649439 [Tanacetum coccineum]